jgi:hypothetical protein
VKYGKIIVNDAQQAGSTGNFLAYIQEVPASNLGPDTDCSHYALAVFLSHSKTSRAVLQIKVQPPPTTSLPIPDPLIISLYLCLSLSLSLSISIYIYIS